MSGPNTGERDITNGDTLYLAVLKRDNADYDSWTMDDIRKLEDVDIRTMVGDVATKVCKPDFYMPSSFRRLYGDRAEVVFNLALVNEYERRGMMDVLPEAYLRGIYNYQANLSAAQIASLKMNGYESHQREDGQTVLATATDYLNHNIYATISQVVAGKVKAEPDGRVRVVVPPEAARVVADTNPEIPQIRQILDPKNVKGLVAVGDEAAFMAGMAIRRDVGANLEVGGIKINYDPAEVREKLPQFATDVFDPNKPDRNVVDALAAGWVYEDIRMQDRAGSNDDHLYRTPSLQVAQNQVRRAVERQ